MIAIQNKVETVIYSCYFVLNIQLPKFFDIITKCICFAVITLLKCSSFVTDISIFVSFYFCMKGLKDSKFTDLRISCSTRQNEYGVVIFNVRLAPTSSEFVSLHSISNLDVIIIIRIHFYFIRGIGNGIF